MNSASLIAYIEMARKLIKNKEYQRADGILQGIEMITLEENNPF